MAIFGAKVDSTDKVFLDYLVKTNRNLNKTGMVKNPYTGKLTNYLTRNFVVVDLTPIYPNLSILGYFVLLLIYVFGGFTFNLLWGMPLIFAGYFHSPHFLYWAFQKGLRKLGYNGEVKKLSNYELIRLLVKG